MFHQNGQEHFSKAKVKPPRLDGKKIGVFASRSPHRPNPIGLTLARLDKVEGMLINQFYLDDDWMLLANRAFSRDVMLTSNMAASLATEINIHLCKHLFTLYAVKVRRHTP